MSILIKLNEQIGGEMYATPTGEKDQKKKDKLLLKESNQRVFQFIRSIYAYSGLVHKNVDIITESQT